MTKLTPKQEKFCLKYIETGNASEAYRHAYDAGNMKAATINRNATALLKNNKVATRLEAQQAEHRERHNVTVDTLTAELEEARDMAKSTEQSATMVSATMGKAKIHGLVADKAISDLNITVELVSFSEK